MAMPQDYDGVNTDESERTNDPTEYKRTCIDFIEDISHDYEAWVDYYKLPIDEDKRRRAEITAVIDRTNEWIAKVAQSIKGIDIVMNDGIQKMAESTAGKPLEIGVFVNQKSGYTETRPGIIDVVVKGHPRKNRKMKLGYHFKEDRFRIESTCGAYLEETNLPLGEFDELNIHLRLHAKKAKPRDVISFTVTICEMENDIEIERRGVSTIVHLV